MSQKSTLLTYRLDSSILVLLSNDVFYEIFNTVYSNIFINFLIIIIMLIISILPFWQILILLCIAGHSLIDTYLDKLRRLIHTLGQFSSAFALPLLDFTQHC